MAKKTPIINLREAGQPTLPFRALTLHQKLEVPTDVIVKAAEKTVKDRHYPKSKKARDRAKLRKSMGYSREEALPKP